MTLGDHVVDKPSVASALLPGLVLYLEERWDLVCKLFPQLLEVCAGTLAAIIEDGDLAGTIFLCGAHNMISVGDTRTGKPLT